MLRAHVLINSIAGNANREDDNSRMNDKKKLYIHTSYREGSQQKVNDWPNRMRRVKRQPIFIKLQFHQSYYNPLENMCSQCCRKQKKICIIIFKHKLLPKPFGEYGISATWHGSFGSGFCVWLPFIKQQKKQPSHWIA